MKQKPTFESEYQKIFQDRWTELKKALLKPKKHFLRLNQFTLNQFAIDQLAVESKKSFPPFNLFSSSPFEIASFTGWIDSLPDPLPVNSNNLQYFYPMDAASLFPVCALNPQPNENILDLCAAPGGKSLLILEKLLFPKKNSTFFNTLNTPSKELSLTLNDRSKIRTQKLLNVLKNYLPPEIISQIRITSYAGERWYQVEKNTYDKILLDAPCSSERHVLHSAEHLKKWSPSRPKRLSHEQLALLCSAFEVLKPGGRLVYSTCSLNPLENDLVIERFLKKRPAKIILFENIYSSVEGNHSETTSNSLTAKVSSVVMGTSTHYGWQILPDVCDGWGPIYFCVIEK